MATKVAQEKFLMGLAFAGQLEASIKRLEKAQDNGELANSLILIRNLIQPWIKALRPTEED